MAEENDDNDNIEGEDGEGQKSPISGKKKLIIIIVIAVLVLAASIVGTLWMLGIFDSDDDTAMESDTSEQMVTEEAVPNKPKPAMYFPIKPAFVVNFSSRGRQRFLQADVTIMTRDPDVFTAMQSHLPLVKNRLVMLFSGEVYEELQTDEGKELLRQKSRDALQELMQQELGKQGVEEVLFTNFVMQ